MCMFSGPVKVSATRIAALLSGDGRQQFTAYEMEFDQPAPLSREQVLLGLGRQGVAMILPAPWKQGDAPVKMVDMSAIDDFFDKLETLIDKPRYRGGGGSRGLSFGTDGFLEVLDVGNFSVSIAYTLEDIARANPDVFSLSEDAAKTLRANYSEGFAFIICALRKSGKIHPIGYIHDAASGALFVPTRHEHGGEGLPEWDHTIYATTATRAAADAVNTSDGYLNFHPGYATGEDSYSYTRRTWETLVAAIPELAPFANIRPVAKFEMEGKFANTDFHPVA